MDRQRESQSAAWRRATGTCVAGADSCWLLLQVLAVATAPVAALMGGNVRQVGAMLVILLVGLLNVYLK
jgi:hypothetical protein